VVEDRPIRFGAGYPLLTKQCNLALTHCTWNMIVRLAESIGSIPPDLWVSYLQAHYRDQAPFSSSRQHLSYDGGKKGDYRNCSVLYCALKLCTVISALKWAVLTVLWIAFCHIGLMSLCIDSFVFMFILCFFLNIVLL